MISNNIMDRAITDARALLDTLVSSDWQELHVVSGETEIFIARADGGFNPMRAAANVSDVELPAAPATGPETSVMTQHVATLVHALPVGTDLKAGDTVATIRVLDTEEAIPAPVAGRITSLSADVGALLEYGMPILSIAQAA
ncbi:Acetyl-CoA carboxylase, biotin carboxyl carrier protein [Sphingobium yanoikuyae]|uniref:Acetyl-CoA carboxylase, biotin carboxyl carrier protein n=2 Tax=Sphingobium yanoikuyae TaxID=13690 RepID=A0A084ESV3_SPHYA|nr:Acetyl-CoA carboxylase, biotin carboxyl carrier protein [Sphingobium yanoikuyae]